MPKDSLEIQSFSVDPGNAARAVSSLGMLPGQLQVQVAPLDPLRFRRWSVLRRCSSCSSVWSSPISLHISATGFQLRGLVPIDLSGHWFEQASQYFCRASPKLDIQTWRPSPDLQSSEEDTNSCHFSGLENWSTNKSTLRGLKRALELTCIWKGSFVILHWPC